MKRYWRGRK